MLLVKVRGFLLNQYWDVADVDVSMYSSTDSWLVALSRGSTRSS